MCQLIQTKPSMPIRDKLFGVASSCHVAALCTSGTVVAAKEQTSVTGVSHKQPPDLEIERLRQRERRSVKPGSASSAGVAQASKTVARPSAKTCPSSKPTLTRRTPLSRFQLYLLSQFISAKSGGTTSNVYNSISATQLTGTKIA